MRRISLLDALRALALLGIVIVHSHDHFNFYVYPPPAGGIIGMLDSAATWAYEHLFVSKAFLLFSFLFGLSFFIQLDRAEQRGIDFRARFMWRLLLLLLLGMVHTLFYDGDILTIFGILGIILIPLYKIPKWLLLVLSGLFLARIPSLWELAASLWTGKEAPLHLFNYSFEAAGPRKESVYATGSFLDVARWNLSYGQTGKWKFFIESGRIWQTLGLFILGTWAGRQRLFENVREHLSFFRKLVIAALFIWVATLAISPLLSQLHHPISSPLIALTTSWGNLAYISAFVATICIASTSPHAEKFINALAPVGKITLTCYVSQSIIFTFLYFGWGLGLAPYMGSFLSVASAIILFAIQATLCRLWLKKCLYGPLEWLWRSGTQCHWQPMKKNRSPRND